MATWYWKDNGEQHGPLSSQELKALADAGRITGETFVLREGGADWVAASMVKGLFGQQAQPVDSPPPSHPDGADSSAANKVLETARERAAGMLNDLRSHNWRQEILPIDESNLREMARDYAFWCIALLGTVPLLIWTIEDLDYQLTGFALFFAVMWGVTFKYFVVRAPAKNGWLIASALFTGIVGIPGLMLIHTHFLPEGYVNMPTSKNGLVRLVGSVLQTGVWEESCKAVPVLVYLVWKRKQAEPLTAVLIGVFSGLGFAAFENVDYGIRSIVSSYDAAQKYGAAGHVVGVQVAMIQTLARSVSLVFCHAVWSGIVAYFFVLAFWTRRRAIPLAVVGLGLAACLHGSYNWLAGLQLTFATLVVAGSFVLFYAYVTKLRSLVSEGTGLGEASVDPASSSDAQADAATSAVQHRSGGQARA